MISLKALKAGNLKRYNEIARLMVKYGRSDLVRQVGLEEALEEQADRSTGPAANAEELAADLETLGPTYIKIGQMLSTRADMLPIEYLDALSRLQDDVVPIPFDVVKQVIEEDLHIRLNRAFSDFSETPIAAASLGQVHRATLPSGKQVAVKVQRPGVGKQIVEDFEALQILAEAIDKHTEMGQKYEFGLLLDDVRRSLIRELDYREEAKNLRQFSHNLRESPRLVVPLPVDDYTTSRVLVMDYIAGTKITTISPVVLLEVDRRGLLDELFRSYLHQILIDGFFHADPHPGNVFLTTDRRIALIDLGMVHKVPPGKQDQVLKLLLAIAEGRGDEAATIIYSISEAKVGVNQQAFHRDITELVLATSGTELKGLKFGQIFMNVQRVAADNGVRLPTELRMIGKALLNLERVGNVLDDSFDPSDSIRRNALEIMQRRVFKSLSTTNLISSLAEIKEFAEKLPRRLNQLLEMFANNELKLNVDAIDEKVLMAGFQKVANRITVGLVLAAMIVGAAIIMDIDTSYRLFGYPGLAMIMFLFASLVAGGLVIHILWHDIKEPRPPKGQNKH